MYSVPAYRGNTPQGNQFIPMMMNLDYAPQQYNQVNLMNLISDMKEYEAKKESNTLFDFAKGDPLATTKVMDIHKEKGGNLAFANSSGKQELGVVD